MVDPAPAGWTRVIVKSKFGAGRDFSVKDLQDNEIYFIDGKIGPRPKAEVRDGAGNVVYNITGQVLGIPKKISVTRPDGTEVAQIKAKAFSVIKDKMTVTMDSGPDWQLQGSLLEKDYSMKADGQPVAQITQKWITVRDAYTLDVVQGADLPLALAVLWAVDRWVERD